MLRVDLESPYAGNVAENVEYAKRCMKDSIARGEAPLASHLLYPGILDDTIPEERELGIKAGDAWAESAEKTVVYVDRGISNGMRAGVADAFFKGRPREYRSIEPNGGAKVIAATLELENYAESMMREIVCP